MASLGMTYENRRPSPAGPVIEFFSKNAWAMAIVASSVIAQWAVFGVRLDSVEDRIDRQGMAITELRSEVQETKEQYAALNEKVDSVKESVDYIRNRIDRALSQ